MVLCTPVATLSRPLSRGSPHLYLLPNLHPMCATAGEKGLKTLQFKHIGGEETKKKEQQRTDLLQAHIKADRVFQCWHSISENIFPHAACISCLTHGSAAWISVFRVSMAKKILFIFPKYNPV